jgi:hypothetical protein
MDAWSNEVLFFFREVMTNEVLLLSLLLFHFFEMRVCSLGMQTQNISSSTYHIESLDACMEY